jgi:hypothetical protein
MWLIRGSFCEVCAVAVGHLLYIPPPELKLLKIGDPSMQFGPEHAWLKAAIAVPSLLGQPLPRGEVFDGTLTTADKAEVPLSEGFVTLHECCWRLAGEPKSAEAVPRTSGLHSRALVEAYRYFGVEGAFDYRGACDNGKGWLLCDPDGTTPEAQRSRAHIVQLIEASRTRGQTGQTPAANVADLLRTDAVRTFAVGEVDDRAIVRYRGDITRGLDVSGYPTMFRVIRAYEPGGGRPFGPHMDAIDQFEIALRAAVEEGAAAVLTSAIVMNCSRAQYILYARNEGATRATIEALAAQQNSSLETEYVVIHDPRWAVYFDQVWPERAQS